MAGVVHLIRWWGLDGTLAEVDGAGDEKDQDKTSKHHTGYYQREHENPLLHVMLRIRVYKVRFLVVRHGDGEEENKKADLNSAHHSVEQVENPGCSLPLLLADLQYSGGGLEEVAGGGGHEKQGKAGEADGKSDFENAKPVVESRLVDCVLEEKPVAEFQRKKRRDEGNLEIKYKYPMF